MNEVQNEIKKQTIGYISAALALVAGLAWNDAIKALLDALFPAGGGVIAKFIYAGAITIVVVILITSIRRFFEKAGV